MPEVALGGHGLLGTRQQRHLRRLLQVVDVRHVVDVREGVHVGPPQRAQVNVSSHTAILAAPAPRLAGRPTLRMGNRQTRSSRHARGSDRFRGPLPHRPRLQGVAQGPPARRPDRDDRARPRWTRSRSSTRRDIDDLYLGCGLPGGESGFNMGRIVSVLLGYDHLPGATITRYCSSSVQTTRMAFHAIKAGEGDVFISAGVETVSRFAKGNSDSLPDTHEPGLRRRQGPHRRARPGRPGLARPARGRARSRTSTSRWARPRRTSPGCAGCRARSSTSSACAARTSPRRRSTTASGPARSPRSPPPTAPWSPPTTAPAPA